MPAGNSKPKMAFSTPPTTPTSEHHEFVPSDKPTRKSILKDNGDKSACEIDFLEATLRIFANNMPNISEKRWAQMREHKDTAEQMAAFMALVNQGVHNREHISKRCSKEHKLPVYGDESTPTRRVVQIDLGQNHRKEKYYRHMHTFNRNCKAYVPGRWADETGEGFLNTSGYDGTDVRTKKAKAKAVAAATGAAENDFKGGVPLDVEDVAMTDAESLEMLTTGLENLENQAGHWKRREDE